MKQRHVLQEQRPGRLPRQYLSAYGRCRTWAVPWQWAGLAKLHGHASCWSGLSSCNVTGLEALITQVRFFHSCKAAQTSSHSPQLHLGNLANAFTSSAKNHLELQCC